MTRLKSLAAAAAIGVGAVLAVGGYSLGAATKAPVDTACVTSKNVLSHIYGSAHSCPKGQHKLSWEQQAPAATAGPSGLATITVTANGEASVIAVCPASHPYVLGGGGTSENNAYGLLDSHPVEVMPSTPGPSPTPSPSSTSISPGPGSVASGVKAAASAAPSVPTGGWFAGVDDTEGVTVDVTAYAVCAK
jgi:hypothetical protein